MNNTALFGRVSGVLIGCFILIGCAAGGTTTPNQERPVHEDSIVAGQNYETAVEANSYAYDTAQVGQAEVFEKELLPETDETFGIGLAWANTFDRVTISANAQEGDFDVLRLNSPERLVIDVRSRANRLNRIFPADEAQFIKAVRLGAHEDRGRVVLDLGDMQGVQYDVSLYKGNVVVTFAEAGNLANATASIFAPSQSAQNYDFNPQDGMQEGTAQSNIAFASPATAATEDHGDEDHEADHEEEDHHDHLVLKQDQPEPLILEEETPKAAPDLNKITTPAKPKLVGVSLEPSVGGGNVLIAEMDSAGIFSLKKTAPSEYVLTLEGANIEQSAKKTLLAPAQSGSIRSVRPVVNGADVLLRIFAAPDADLAAQVKGGKIVVGNNIDNSYGSDPRAQAEVELSDTDAPATNGDSVDSEISALLEETPRYTGRLISLDLQDTDIDNALRIIAEVSNLNIIASDDVTGKVTLRLIDVPWDQALDVILKTNGLDKVQEGNVIRVAPVEKLRQEREALKQAQEAEEELEPLQVRYMRISYARAADLQPLLESVVTERGNVSYDERTNQIIVKDIMRGLRNAAQLVAKLDLRTPQVLLETQVVEAARGLNRELGAELGFALLQTPETGNATGYNFPNSVEIGGGLGNDTFSSFPAAVGLNQGSALNVLLDAADGATSLDARLTALEQESRVRVISRPAVATTNNQTAEIKSVEKIRVRTPSGGLSVATGQGASASGSSSSATEVIEIGITLEVTPQASPDYYVLLDVAAKSSSFGTNDVDGIPSEVERSATSTVLVSSGQTFALGGIYKITDDNRVSGVPFFKDIPFLGHLFRQSRTGNADEELIFFVTPRIVEGSFDDAAMKINS